MGNGQSGARTPRRSEEQEWVCAVITPDDDAVITNCRQEGNSRPRRAIFQRPIELLEVARGSRARQEARRSAGGSANDLSTCVDAPCPVKRGLIHRIPENEPPASARAHQADYGEGVPGPERNLTDRCCGFRCHCCQEIVVCVDRINLVVRGEGLVRCVVRELRANLGAKGVRRTQGQPIEFGTQSEGITVL